MKKWEKHRDKDRGEECDILQLGVEVGKRRMK